MIAASNPERRIHRANVSIENILRRSEQTRVERGGAIFQFGAVLDQDKTVRIFILSFAWQLARSAEPLRGTGIFYKVINSSKHRRRFDFNIHPEWTIGCGTCSEQITSFISDVPIATIIAFKERRSEVHRDIDRLPRFDLSGQECIAYTAQDIAATKGKSISCCPRTGTYVLQAPDLGEL